MPVVAIEISQVQLDVPPPSIQLREVILAEASMLDQLRDQRADGKIASSGPTNAL
jgi:hypothetical protein